MAGNTSNIKDLINSFNKQQHIIRPKSVVTKKTKPPQNNSNRFSVDHEEDESYDEIQRPPQKPSYSKNVQVEKNSDEEDSSEDSEEYSEFSHYFNASEIVDEKNNFLREEENYCQLLADLVENYVDLVNTEKFDDVFGGIDTICTYQNNTFLPDLISSKHVGEIAECFIRHKKLFTTYYEHYFSNQPNMIFIMTDNKDIFQAGLSKKQYNETESILIKSLNERILSYNNFFKDMQEHLAAHVDTSTFDRVIAILNKLTTLFSPKDENIRYLISEIIETERVYIKKLETITKQTIPRIEKVIKRKSAQMSIIGNVPLIYTHQLEFYNDLEQCLMTFDPNEVGNCFLQHKKLFMEYINDQKMKDNPDVINECRELLKNDSDKFVDFHAPLNRLYKYKILLQELNKKCDKGGVPAEKVADALNMIAVIISKMNGVAAINCIHDENLYLDEQGELIIRDEFMVKSKERRYDAMIFLFEKSIVFTEIKIEGSEKIRSDTYIYRNHIITKRLSLTVNNESPTDFQVSFHGRSKKILHVLRAKNKHTKIVWIAVLNKILKEQFEKEKQNSVMYN